MMLEIALDGWADRRDARDDKGVTQGEAAMLFQVSYTTRAGGSVEQNESGAKRALALFGKWSPPAGLEIKSFYARADGKGGTLIVETDNVAVLAEGPAKFGALNEFEIVPVLDIMEAVPIYSEAIAWAESIT
jgi:hypothetical protein